jgi:hypothetical protein
MRELKVLVACESSGTVANAFYWAGHDAWSCDILPADDDHPLHNRHIQGDVREVLKMEQWDLLMVAHPPCTRLCNSGVRWLHKAPPNRTLESMWSELDEGAALFRELMDADVPLIAIENPVMHKHAKVRIWGDDWAKLSKSDGTFIQTSVQPYEFAESVDSEDNVTKRTCLWLKGLPPLQKTSNLTRETARHDIHMAPPSKDRWKQRSKFHRGLAQAMASQWGGLDLWLNGEAA